VLQWTVESRGSGEIVVAFDGEITAMTDFQDVKVAGYRAVVLDLAGVRRLNSRGTHDFLEFLRSISKNGRISAERCSPGVVTQLNLVPAIAEYLDVRSLYLPLECPKCFHEDEALVDVEGAQRPAIPQVLCPKCQATMIEAEPPERYFSFLNG
jgi:anti-anti-sigma regulatory factor